MSMQLKHFKVASGSPFDCLLMPWTYGAQYQDTIRNAAGGNAAAALTKIPVEFCANQHCSDQSFTSRHADGDLS